MTVSNPFKPDPRVYKEAKSLAKAGHEVIVIAWDREGRYPKEEEVEGFRVIRVGPSASYGSLMAVKLPLFYLKALKLILKLKPDVVHTHDFDTAILGYVFKKIFGMKWVYDVHDLYDDLVGNNLAKRIIKKVDLLFLKTTDIIITTNIERSKVLLGRGARTRIINILNTPDDIPAKIHKKKGRFRVFYGGVLSKDRFILEFIEISRVLGIPLRIAGMGVLEDAVKAEKHVTFLGYLPHEKIMEETSKAHLTFSIYNPNIFNNLISIPNKLFEAMAVGTPILIVKGTATARLSGKFGIPVEYNTESVKATLEYLINTPKVLRKKSRLGPKMFKKYAWELQGKKLVKAYKRWVL